MKAKASCRKIFPTSSARSSPPRGTAPDWGCHWRVASWKRTADRLTSAVRPAKERDSKSGCPSHGKNRRRRNKGTALGQLILLWKGEDPRSCPCWVDRNQGATLQF